MPTCLITGANRGLGLEFAKQYAADGWKVIATCREPGIAEELKALEGDVHIHALDVTDFAQVEALGKQLNGEAIDLLVKNAGVYGPRVVPHHSVDYAAWAEVLRANAMAPLKMCAVFEPHVAKGKLRRIVAVSSLMGSMTDNSSGGSYIYRSSKAALNAVMKSLAADLKEKEIAVAVLHPGWVKTDMGGPSAKIEASESVAGMRKAIDHMSVENTGRFLNYDGTELPW